MFKISLQYSYFLIISLLLVACSASSSGGAEKLISKNAVIKAHSSTSDWSPSNAKLAAKAMFTDNGEDYWAAYDKNTAELTDPYGFHTDEEEKPWIIVDLKKQYNIKRIKIVNRIDCCEYRLINLTIETSLDKTQWSKVDTEIEDGIDVWEGAVEQKGRYVRLMLNSVQDEPQFFHLTKIFMYGN